MVLVCLVIHSNLLPNTTYNKGQRSLLCYMIGPFNVTLLQAVLGYLRNMLDEDNDESGGT